MSQSKSDENEDECSDSDTETITADEPLALKVEVCKKLYVYTNTYMFVVNIVSNYH